MSPFTLDELRAWLTRDSVGVEMLQRVWQARAWVGWVQDRELARCFVQWALRKGELLLACNSAREALTFHPGDLDLRQKFSNTLVQMGATDRAERELLALIEEGNTDSETLSLLGRVYKEEWQTKGDTASLRRSFEHYRRAFHTPSNEATYPGINAATVALLLGESEAAKSIAREVLALCEAKERAGEDSYWNKATAAEAFAVLGRLDEARRAYREAAVRAGGDLRNLCSTRRQARLLSGHLFGRTDLFDQCFTGMKLVVFSGHMIDAPDRETPRFPPSMEAEVKESIAKKLAELDAGIGFASAARGGDILFLEAMLERGATVHVVLPWSQKQFIQTSVALEGDATGRWIERFNAVLARAASVREIGEVYMPSSTVGLDYCNLVLNGQARIYSRWLDLECKPVALWDGTPGLPGGTGSFVEYWQRQGKEIDIIALPRCGGAGAPRQEASTLGGNAKVSPNDKSPEEDERQEIRTMLFADVVGYAELPEAKLPKFVSQFMTTVSRLIAESEDAPIFTNTWGDAFYFVFSRVDQAGRFALELLNCVTNTDWSVHGLAWENENGVHPFNIRIGLHAGPVYMSFDPIIQRINFTGTHVSRAARIEPVTEPGEVFVSEEFAALAAAENASGFVCEVIGTIPLAKRYGLHGIFNLRKPHAHAPLPPNFQVSVVGPANDFETTRESPHLI